MGWFFVSMIGLAAAPFDGWCIYLLWKWYIVPLGVPAIGVMHGLGIAFIAKFLNGSKSEDFEEEHEALNRMIQNILEKLMLLGITYFFYGLFGI